METLVASALFSLIPAGIYGGLACIANIRAGITTFVVQYLFTVLIACFSFATLDSLGFSGIWLKIYAFVLASAIANGPAVVSTGVPAITPYNTTCFVQLLWLWAVLAWLAPTSLETWLKVLLGIVTFSIANGLGWVIYIPTEIVAGLICAGLASIGWAAIPPNSNGN